MLVPKSLKKLLFFKKSSKNKFGRKNITKKGKITYLINLRTFWAIELVNAMKIELSGSFFIKSSKNKFGRKNITKKGKTKKN